MSLFDRRRVLEKEIVERAIKDKDFRAKLLANPKAALEAQWGVTLPAGLTIDVHPETRNHLHLVLPATGGPESGAQTALAADDSWSSWGHFSECVVECTQCGNNDTSCEPGDSGE